MRRLVVLLAISAAAGALGLTACGGGNDKPPMTPDSEHMTTPGDDDDMGVDAGTEGEGEPAPAPVPGPESDPS